MAVGAFCVPLNESMEVAIMTTFEESNLDASPGQFPLAYHLPLSRFGW
jgi:hypothetical protein